MSTFLQPFNEYPVFQKQLLKLSLCFPSLQTSIRVSGFCCARENKIVIVRKPFRMVSPFGYIIPSCFQFHLQRKYCRLKRRMVNACRQVRSVPLSLIILELGRFKSSTAITAVTLENQFLGIRTALHRLTGNSTCTNCKKLLADISIN